VSFDPQQIQDILVIIVAAATPLLLAAIGEVVAERAGVLNLGLEGMMIVGASTGFAFAYLTDSTLVGVVAGILGGVLLSGIFAFLTIGLATNQVAAGLALTIFGRGLANLIGEGFVGLKRFGAPHLYIPGLSDLPLVGRLIFGEDFFVYFAILLTGAVGYWLMRTRAGLTLRAVGENHTSAHSLGVPVRGIRLLAVLFLVLHAILVARHDGGPRLDRPGARRLRLLEGVACAGRRVAVRRRRRSRAGLPGTRGADPRPTSQLTPLSDNHYRAGCAFTARQSGGAGAGVSGPGLHSRSLTRGRTPYFEAMKIPAPRAN
jgi:hypothetical protein